MKNLNRRHVLSGAAAMATLPSALPALAASPSLAGDMKEAATRFLNTGAKGARFDLQGDEPTRWHWTNVRRFPRKGAVLSAMTTEQRTAAMDLVDASLSEAGAHRVREIMKLEALIKRDPEAYYWSIFGEPGEGIWGWRLEGHHLSHHFRVSGKRVSAFPYFQGAWPNKSATGERPLGKVEDMALDLITGLPASAREKAVVAERASFGHATGNAVVAAPLESEGLKLADAGVADAGRALAAAYLDSLPDAEAKAALARFDKAGADKVHMSWRGPLDIDKSHYWRLQGPGFVLEWDDTLNGGNHIHSVWRDYATDFGKAV